MSETEQVELIGEGGVPWTFDLPLGEAYAKQVRKGSLVPADDASKEALADLLEDAPEVHIAAEDEEPEAEEAPDAEPEGEDGQEPEQPEDEEPEAEEAPDAEPEEKPARRRRSPAKKK